MRSRGFTLLEMLLATALTAVLVGGVMAVVTSVARPLPGNAASRAGLSQELPIESVLAMVRDDLRNARALQMSDDGVLTMAGNMAINATAREQTHRPAVVTYKIEQIGGRHWLVRSQSRLDTLTNEPTQYDLVCAGVRGFDLLRDGEAIEGMVAGGSGSDTGNDTNGGEETQSGLGDVIDDSMIDGVTDDGIIRAEESTRGVSLGAAAAQYTRQLNDRFRWAQVISGNRGEYKWQLVDMQDTAQIEQVVADLSGGRGNISEADRVDQLAMLQYVRGINGEPLPDAGFEAGAAGGAAAGGGSITNADGSIVTEVAIAQPEPIMIAWRLKLELEPTDEAPTRDGADEPQTLERLVMIQQVDVQEQQAGQDPQNGRDPQTAQEPPTE